MDVRRCRQCSDHCEGARGPWCELAHAFVVDFSICPKDLTVEQIKESCNNFLPEMDDGESGCLGHLAEGRCFPCWIKDVGNLRQDTCFEFGEEFLTEEGKKNRP